MMMMLQRSSLLLPPQTALRRSVRLCWVLNLIDASRIFVPDASIMVIVVMRCPAALKGVTTNHGASLSMDFRQVKITPPLSHFRLDVRRRRWLEHRTGMSLGSWRKS